MKIKDIICLALFYIRIPEIYRFFIKIIAGNQIPILMYHRVTPQNEKWSMSATDLNIFEKQIKWLNRNFNIIKLSELIQIFQAGKINDKKYQKAVVITFDDGYKDNYLYAYPILKKYKIPATIFLTSGYIDTGNLFWWDIVGYIICHTKKKNIDIPNFGKFSLIDNKEKFNCISFLLKKFKKIPNNLKNNYIINLQNICEIIVPPGLGKKMILSWDEIREMKDNGITFGVHAATHPNLTNISLAEAEKEIKNSKKMIENQLKTDATLFAYPYGSKLDYNSEIIKLIKNIGFKGAVTTNYGLVNKYNIDSIYSLPRIWVSNYYSRFKIEVSGIFSDFNFIFHYNR
jgi:peptidoglycan/xylan/chitin deacetylase (PgdA/CDA1 family)